MRAIIAGLPLVAALWLTGCDRPGDGTSITINVADGNASDGNMLGAIDGKSGEVKVALPGFNGQFKLPKVKLDAGDFQLNGVHLYPGSTIDAVDVGSGDGVRVRFTSPAAAPMVRDWFQRRLTDAGFTLKTDGDGLSGRTEENKPFRLELDGGADRAKGTIVLGN
ncbi:MULTISPECIES: hypothetical protein [unclassified Sphingomonas]|uniref:hypothetical protein n=1 Tax=unclassified Sphingomonas TaxID=196159 RepID=UPI000E10917B|nr:MULTISPECIES: hypothetical protein [unclassified Sphingomonas]AXJ96054.1 hypothetical protein DM480_11610 [Sphingomonas sp. FARSPH]